uniref:BSD domain-containing protein n=1 Tax=Alexandrium monilatum TaxID=311494 RepID=A0A7S4RDX4_9DINO
MGQQQLLAGLVGDAKPAEVELRSPREIDRARLSRPFPWADLVSRAADARSLSGPSSLSWEPPASEVLALLEEVEPRVRALGEGPEEFLGLCPPCDGAGSAMVPTSWAAALLEQLPDLRRTRFCLVPRRLSEEAFWARYFGAVFAILAEALSAAAVERTAWRPGGAAGDPRTSPLMRAECTDAELDQGS